MKTFFSIISTETNHFSGEQIAVGLIFVTPEKVYYKYAPSKLNWLKKLDSGKGYFQLTETALKNIQKTVKEHNKAPYLLFEKTFSKEYFKYLNQYAAGAIAFSGPKPINIKMDDAIFEDYFKKMIGVTELAKHNSKISFNHKIKKIIQAKNVEAYADIDYKLKADQIEGILQDTKLPLITMNGSVQALETIDFKQTNNTVTSHLYKAEIIYNSLAKFCKYKDLKMAKLKLAFNQPKKENQNLFNMVYKEKKKAFEFNELNEVEGFINEIADSKNNYHKFSEILHNH